MQDKKLGFLCSSGSRGGLEINVIRLARWLGGLGYQVVLFCLEGTYLSTAAREMQLPVRHIAGHRKVLDLMAGRNLFGMLNREGVGTLMLFENKDISVAGIAKTLSRNRLRLVYQQQMQLGVPKRDMVHTRRFSRLDAWITPLEFLKEEISRRTRFDMQRVHVIPLGIEMRTLTANVPSKQEALAEFGLDPGDPVIGILGRIDPYKGQHFLIGAVARLKQTGRDVRLLIVGEATRNESGDYIERLHRMCAELEIQDRVHFRPFTDRLAAFYRAIDIFAMTSYGETYGMVTIEAMTSAVPVIASRSPANRELLHDGTLGRLYDPDDTDGFCRHVLELTDHPEAAQEMAVRARDVALIQYDHLRECRMIAEVLDRLG